MLKPLNRLWRWRRRRRRRWLFLLQNFQVISWNSVWFVKKQIPNGISPEYPNNNICVKTVCHIFFASSFLFVWLITTQSFIFERLYRHSTIIYFLQRKNTYDRQRRLNEIWCKRWHRNEKHIPIEEGRERDRAKKNKYKLQKQIGSHIVISMLDAVKS